MIRLTDDYYIDMDDKNYILCWDYKRVDKKTGNRVYRPLGYFGKIQDLVNYWVEKSVKDSLSEKDEISLGEAVKIISEELNKSREILKAAIPDITIFKTL